MLEKRRKLAMELLDVCAEVDAYIEKIGGNVDDPDVADATHTGCMIYCEPEVASRVVREYIELKLRESKNGDM